MGTIKVAPSTQLQAHGRAAETPVAVISQGTLPNSKSASGKLCELAALAKEAEKPALIVIGEVVALQPHKFLSWFGEQASEFIATQGIFKLKPLLLRISYGKAL